MIVAGASAPLIAIFALSASIWVGGLVAISIVARAASATLEPGQRVALFRTVGRNYGVVGTSALLVAMISGAALLEGRGWDGLLIATAAVAAALLIVAAIGMAQARAMTRLRREALAEPGAGRDRRVRRGAILAAALRGAIAALTLALVCLGAALAA